MATQTYRYRGGGVDAATLQNTVDPAVVVTPVTGAMLLDITIDDANKPQLDIEMAQFGFVENTDPPPIGGQRELVSRWGLDGVAAGVTNLIVPAASGVTAQVVGRPARGAQLVVWRSLGNVSGVLTAELTKNGAGTGVVAVMDAGAGAAFATADASSVTLDPGDRIATRVSTSAGWTGTSADVSTAVVLQF